MMSRIVRRSAFLFTLLLLLVGTRSWSDEVTERTLPRVVLVGDSIRLSYAPIVAKLLAGKAIVVSPKANGNDSSNVLKHLDNWVIREKPTLVHFNCGIHDTKKFKMTGKYQVSPEQYATNLKEIVERIREETGAMVLFATTTPILDDRAAAARQGRDYELLGDSVEHYNRIARKVMAELDVPVDDLHTTLIESQDPSTADLLGKDGVHLVPDGQRLLGETVAKFIERHLASPEERSEQPKQRTVHKLELIDPVTPEEPAQSYALIETRDEQGFPVDYSLALKTHVCVDQQCREVEVTLFWDAAGYFQRLEYPPDKPLTKKDHIPFKDEDYTKLDGIIKDRQCILKDWTLAYLEQPVAQGLDVDAITSATPITVRNSVVENAAYTCWALWHWANGPIVPLIRQYTEKSCSANYLNHLLESEDRRLVDFALEYALQHTAQDKRLVPGVLHVIETGERDQVPTCLKYLKSAITDRQERHRQLIEACCRMSPTDIPIILRDLASEPDLPPATLEELTAQLSQFPYYPVHLVLRMLEERGFSSPTTLTNVEKLLNGDDFFIARRAYEYLRKQQLEGEAKRRLALFREEHRDRL